MAILSAMQAAAIRLMGQRPTVFFGASQKFEIELSDLINEVAQDIVQSNDWQALIRVNTLTGDGVSEAFALPADYSRMLVKSDVQDLINWAWGYENIHDINEFLYRQAHGFEPFPGGWIIFGNQMQFTPAPGVGDQATYPYISSFYARDSQTLQNKAAFDNDADTFLLPERLLTLGLIWRWRENKKLDFTGDQEAFMKAISEYAAKDTGSRIYRTGARWPRGRFSTAYPWVLGGV